MAPSSNRPPTHRQTSTSSHSTLDDLLVASTTVTKRSGSSASVDGGGRDRDHDGDNGHRSSRDHDRRRRTSSRSRSRSHSSSQRRGRSHTEIRKGGRREVAPSSSQHDVNDESSPKLEESRHRSKSKDRQPRLLARKDAQQPLPTRGLLRVVHDNNNHDNLSPLSNRSMLTSSVSTDPSLSLPPAVSRSPVPPSPQQQQQQQRQDRRQRDFNAARTRSQSPMKRFKSLLGFGNGGGGNSSGHKLPSPPLMEGTVLIEDIDDGEDDRLTSTRGGKRRSKSGGTARSRPPRTPRAPHSPTKQVSSPTTMSSHGHSHLRSSSSCSVSVSSHTAEDDLQDEIVKEREKNKKLLKKMKNLQKLLEESSNEKDQKDKKKHRSYDDDSEAAEYATPKVTGRKTTVKDEGSESQDMLIQDLQDQLDKKDRRIEELESENDSSILIRYEQQLQDARRQMAQKDELLQAQMSNLVLQCDRVKTLEIQLKKHYDETVPQLQEEVDQLTSEKLDLLTQLENERQKHIQFIQSKDEVILEYQEEINRLREMSGLSSIHTSTTVTTTASSVGAAAAGVGGILLPPPNTKIQQAMSCFGTSSTLR